MVKIKTTAIIPAAGFGNRLSGKVKKQFKPLSGKPLLYYSVNTFQYSHCIDEIVLVVPKEDIEFTRNNIVKKYSFNKVKKLIKGGEERYISVQNGFKAISGDTKIVVIHDAARPFVSSSTIEYVVNNAQEYGSAITSLLVKDTLKEVYPNDNKIKKTVSRENIWRSQTPQAFKYEILKEAYEKSEIEELEITDESQLVEHAGYDVKIIKGSELNIKITTSEDLELAESIIKTGLLN